MGKRKRRLNNKHQQSKKKNHQANKRIKYQKYWIEDCKDLGPDNVEDSNDDNNNNKDNGEATKNVSDNVKEGTSCETTADSPTKDDNDDGSCHVLIWITRADLMDQHHRLSDKKSADKKQKQAAKKTEEGNQPNNVETENNGDSLQQHNDAENDNEEEEEEKGEDKKKTNQPPPPPSVPKPPLTMKFRTDEVKDEVGGGKDPILFVQRAPQDPVPTFAFRDHFVNLPQGDCGDGIRNPYPSHQVPNKFWAQRFRLFAKFDQGIQLDREGWFSVTPEAIANHIAHRMVSHWQKQHQQLSPPPPPTPTTITSETQNTATSPTTTGMVILDAFCGAGGNSLAFALRPEVSMVICVDTDRQRLDMAAHNCKHVYKVPSEKLLFVQQNACEVMSMYQHGQLRRLPQDLKNGDNDRDLLNKLPSRLDAVFLSPPWGGVDYEQIGSRQYDLSCIQLPLSPPSPAPHTQEQAHSVPEKADCNTMTENTEDSIQHATQRSENDDQASNEQPKTDTGSQNREEGAHQKAIPGLEEQSTSAVASSTGQDDDDDSGNNNHDSDRDDGGNDEATLVDGQYVLQLALTSLHPQRCNIVYFLPRNTNGLSLARSAALCGYRGVLEMEQQVLNGKLKTISAYLQQHHT